MWRKTLLYSFIFLLLMAALVTVASFYYEGPVKKYIMKEVNKRLETPVNVSNISFSVWEKFPYASVVFEDVWAHENIVKIGDPDTLFFLKKVYFQFNLIDLWGGSYHIRKIAGNDGFIRMAVDEKGYDNYHFWKQSEDTTGFLLALEDVELNDISFSYHNMFRQQTIGFFIEDLNFSGQFSDVSYAMEVEGEGLAQVFQLRETNYLHNRHISIDTELLIEQEKESYAFRHGDVTIDKQMHFLVAGAFIGNGMDLRIKGVDLDIIQTLQLIPSETAKAFEGYESTGHIDFDAGLKGAFDRTESPSVSFTFAIRDGSIAKKGTPYKIEKLQTRGHLTNGDSREFSTTSLRVDILKGVMGTTELAAAFSVHNFTSPAINGNISAKGKIAEILGFFNVGYLNVDSGSVELQANFATVLQNPDTVTAADFLNANASGTIDVQNAAFRFGNDTRRFYIGEGSFQIRDNDLRIHRASGKLNACPVELEGTIDDFLSFWFVPDGKMHIKGSISAGDLSQDDLFTPTDGTNALALPERFSYDLDLQAASFTWHQFEAREISGHLEIDNFKIRASSLHFLSQGGNVQGSIGLFRFSPNQFGLRSDFSASNIDIHRLFSTFNNFSQKVVRAEHLKGIATADIAVQAFSDSLFHLDLNTLSAEAKLKVTDGELIGFEPLESVGEYISDQKMLRLFIATDELQKRLEHVRFSTLENEIAISKGRVTIPAMEIKSSAIDINVAGTHGFDQRIDYTLDFALSELLTLKNQKEPLNEYVSRDQKGKTVIYLSITGTTDDPKVKLERTNVKQTLKTEIEQERQEVKSVLKEEFGLFRNDTTVAPAKEKKPDVIRVEWNEAKEANPGQKNPEPEKKKSFLDRLMQKTEGNKQTLQNGEFEDDDF